MPTIKTAVSIEQSLFEEIDRLAQEMQVPRSRIFALAVEEYLERRRNQQLLEALNQVYDESPLTAEEEAVLEAMRSQQRQTLEETR